MSDFVNFKPSPYGLYRSNTNMGPDGEWQHFAVNSDGTYKRDANNDYIYNPVWVVKKKSTRKNNSKSSNTK